MPTHRDYPWERDERAAGREPQPRLPEPVWPAPTRRPARSPSRLNAPLDRSQMIGALVSLAVLAAFWIPRQLDGPTGVMQAPIAAGSVTRLHTSFAGPRVLQVWGTTDAPDGASIVLAITAERGGMIRRAAPAVAGRFVARVPVPQALRGRPLHVSAALAP